MEQTLLRNGSLLNKEWLDLFLKIPKFTLVISLESVKKETYEELRKGGNFDELKRNLNLINSQGNSGRFHLLVNIIVMKRNYLEIEEMVNFAIENKFNHIILTPLYTNGSEFYDREYLAPKDEWVRRYFFELIPKIIERAERNNIYLDDRFFGIGKAQATEDGQVGCKEPFDNAICLSPWQQLFIESTGEVKSYCHCVHKLGNIKDTSIKEIWNNEITVGLRKSILERDYHLCNPVCLKGLLDQNNLKLI
jgi:MoaA/NifB/PqqE/SkfB family radical SAM enzyme